MNPVFISPLLNLWGLADTPQLNVWGIPDQLVLFTNLVNYSAKVLNKDWYGAKEICIERLLNLNAPYIWSAQDIMSFKVMELYVGFHTYRQVHNKKKIITEIAWTDTQPLAPEYLAVYNNNLNYRRPVLGASPLLKNIRELILANPALFPICRNCGKTLTLSSNGHWKRKCC